MESTAVGNLKSIVQEGEPIIGALAWATARVDANIEPNINLQVTPGYKDFGGWAAIRIAQSHRHQAED